jgi:Amiloride-sensitive sodium channel
VDFETELIFLESHYNSETQHLDLPIPWNATSSNDRIYFYLRHWESESFIDVDARRGLHFIIHPTDELPSDSSFHFYQHKLHQTLIEIFPQKTIITEELMQMSPERRNCYFNNEKVLELFKVYSKHNCEHECQSLTIAEMCGCVPFYLLSGFSSIQSMHSKVDDIFSLFRTTK